LATFDAKRYQLSSVQVFHTERPPYLFAARLPCMQRVARVCQRQLILVFICSLHFEAPKVTVQLGLGLVGLGLGLGLVVLGLVGLWLVELGL